ncbi:intercellular adhesion molecule 4-like [Carettochelys insculpta]|uniref:intercellular adhesion molecule 4-like n=1 Tax=Carettochelys insculpta TaxID=44489 RepID=UPI003EBE957E
MGPQGLQKHSPLHSLALLLLLGVLPGAAQGSFEVRISPRTAVVEYGGSVWINCSTTCQDRDAPIGLEIPLTKELSRTGPGWIAMHIVNISEWESNPQCYVNCNTTHKLVKGTISAYRAPEQVVLEPLPALVLGQTHTLTCRVWGVAPVRHLTVSLRQGNRTLHTETFHNRTGAGPDNVTVTHEITPQRWDHRQQVTCLTALDLTPHRPLIRNSSAVAELQSHETPTAIAIATAAIATLVVMLLGVLACGLVQRSTAQRRAGPSQAGLEMAPAGADLTSVEGDGWNSPL